MHHTLTHCNIEISWFKKAHIFLPFFYKTMQTWWVFYIYLLFNYLSSIIYVFPSLFLIISFGHQQIKIRNHKIRLFILLISNKQGHTLAYIHIHTHLLLFFVSFTPKLVYLIFLFIILSIWKWECCVGYILMVWHIFCGNQIGKSKHLKWT